MMANNDENIFIKFVKIIIKVMVTATRFYCFINGKIEKEPGKP